MTRDANSSDAPDASGTPSSGWEATPPLARRSQLIRLFVEHWGVMARSWGINATMGELFALLYITGQSWNADDLCRELRVSRGNVSMNLRELIGWGLVHREHHPGERREFFRAESDVWTLVRRILAERKRRELDPTLQMLTEALDDEGSLLIDPGEYQALNAILQRLQNLKAVTDLAETTAQQLLELDRLDPEQIGALVRLLKGLSTSGDA